MKKALLIAPVGTVGPMFQSPCVLPGDPLRRLAKVLAPCRRVVILATSPLALGILGSMLHASTVRLFLWGGVPAFQARGVVILRPARRPWGRYEGGPASLPAAVPGPIPVSSPGDPV